MNTNALKISLNSLIAAGNQINDGKFDDMYLREYIDLYGKTKEYFYVFSDQYRSFRVFYEKLPNIKYKIFRNPYYLMKSYLLEKVRWQYRGIGGVRISELFEVDGYPARTKYLNELTVSILNINKIILEVIQAIRNLQATSISTGL